MGEFAGDRDDDDDELEQFNVEWYDQNNLQLNANMENEREIVNQVRLIIAKYLCKATIRWFRADRKLTTIDRVPYRQSSNINRAHLPSGNIICNYDIDCIVHVRQQYENDSGNGVD